MTVDRSLPWLGFPPAVDLANTVVVTPAGPVDLLTTDDELAVWIQAERGRVPDVDAAHGRLPEVRELRDAVHALLHAAVHAERPPGDALDAVNEASRAARVAPVVDLDLAVRDEAVAADPFERFRAAVARSAIALVSGSGGPLAACGAPSCGMLFVPESARQTWCSPACGNRARVARHAARRRAGAHAPAADRGEAPRRR